MKDPISQSPSSRSRVEGKSLTSRSISTIPLLSVWTSGSISKSLCISASPSQSTVSDSFVIVGDPVDEVGSWVAASLVEVAGRVADGRVGLGARISRRSFSIVISSSVEFVSAYWVIVDDGVGREVDEGVSSSWSWFVACPPAAGTPKIKEGHRWSPPVLGGEWTRTLQHLLGNSGLVRD